MGLQVDNADAMEAEQAQLRAVQHKAITFSVRSAEASAGGVVWEAPMRARLLEGELGGQGGDQALLDAHRPVV